MWSSGIRQKWTTTEWTRDNTSSVNDPLNARPIETNIYDAAGNRRRTTIEYQSSFGLPSMVTEYAADAATVLRRTGFDYKNDAVYIDRRIIGLLFRRTVYDGTWNLVEKSEYGYDWNSSGDMFQDTPAPATQHDRTNYGPTFIVGRGNLSQVARFDVNDPNNASNTWQETKWRVNSTGSVLMQRDHQWHQNLISYGDSFSDGNNSRNTFAYPTTLTDAGGFSSYGQYNFDFGAQTRVQGPPPAGQSQGIIQTFSYDNAVRLSQATTVNNGAYTRNVYGPNYIQTYATVNNVADEAYSVRMLDGVGRVTAVATNHPGSSGGYSAVHSVYDAMGREIKRSNPTEVLWDWSPFGDDAAGWLYTQQTYDWQGRPRVTTNADGTTKEASYGGCGCAGGAVVTLTDEGTIDGGVAKRRQQKLYSDVLGRTVKTEVLNWQGGTVYSATANTYNARDQVTLVRQFQGNAPSNLNDLSCPAGTCQQTVMTYDGRGRLKTKHVPEQNTGMTTAWDYNSDDTIQKITDARGATQSFSYNSRHLVTGVTYGVPSGSGIPVPAAVSFAYDAAGNRTSMTDGLGNKTYSYNQLARLMSETRTFTGVGSFTLAYDYNLVGDLKKVTDPTNMTINYGYDSARRVNSVTGSNNLFMGITNYAWNFQYRAWGGLKAMTNGANRTSSLLYNSRLQPSHFEVNNLVSQNYDYYNDGRLRFVDNLMDANFDRSYSYDRMARLAVATTGGLARGDSGDTPYHESFGYDAFNNLTSRYTLSWSQDEMWDSADYANNRRSGWGYDADGRNTTIGTRTYTFDAAGQTALMTGQRWIVNHYVNTSQSVAYDGEGLRVKEVIDGVTTYYLTSTVLGGSIIAELNGSGQKNAGYVYSPGGVPLARQVPAGANSYIAWKHGTPAGTGQHDFNVGGAFGSGGSQRFELDPLGASVPLEYVPPPETQSEGDVGGLSGGILDARYANFFDTSGGCMMDYMATSCSMAMGAVNSDAGVVTDPYESPEFWWNQKLADEGLGGWMKFRAFADGQAMYVPVNGVYIGNGLWAIQRNEKDSKKGSQQKTGKVTLTKEQRKDYDDAKAVANSNLHSDPCAIFLAGAGFSPTDISTALAVQNPFNGLSSTINALAAGVAKPGQLIAKDTVQQLIKESALRAMVGIWSADTRYDVYLDLNRYNPLILLHEALHSATGLGDDDLARKLGVYDPVNPKNSSGNVSEILSDNGCGDLPND